MKTISLIKDQRVTESKGGNLWCVDGTVELDTLTEMSEVLLSYHIAPSIFQDNQRNKQHFISTQFLSFDFDDGKTTSVKVHEDCIKKQWNHVIVGSKNYMKDKGDGLGIIERYHLFIPVRDIITDIDMYKYTIKTIGKIMNWTIDPAVCDVTRYFYKHSIALYVCEDKNNIRTDWIVNKKKEDEKIIEEKRKLEQRKTEIRIANGGKILLPVERFKRTYAWTMLTKEMDGTGQYGKGNIILGVMKKCGLDQDMVIDLFSQYNSPHGKSHNIESIVERWNKFT